MSYFVVVVGSVALWACIVLLGRRLGLRLSPRQSGGVLCGIFFLIVALSVLPSTDNRGSDVSEASEDGSGIPSKFGDTRPEKMGSRSARIVPQDSAQHANLVQSALRTPESAFQLSMQLMQCSGLERLVEEHEKLSDRLNRKQLHSAVSYLDALSKNCLPLLGMNDKTAYDLVHHAASSGLLEAQLSFPAVAATYINSSENLSLDANVIRQFKAESLRFAREAASSGAPEGLYHAYTVYSDGLFVAKNDRAAYYYLSEYLKLRPSVPMHAELARLAVRLDAQERRTPFP